MALKRFKSWLYGAGVRLTYIRPGNRAKFLNVGRMRNGDTFMCSYPRSGNTWTRMVVACLIDSSLKTIYLDLIDIYVPECSTANCKFRPRVFKEHSPKFNVFPKVIYNYRDGRDCIVSAYRYAVSSLGYTKSRLDFLVDRNAQIFGFWHEHVKRAIQFQLDFPGRILMIQYETMRASPEESIYSLAQFLEIKVSDSRVAEIVELTDLQHQKNRGNKYVDPRKKNTLGHGLTGGWRQELDSEELKIFEGMASPILKELGYPLSFEQISSPGTSN